MLARVLILAFSVLMLCAAPTRAPAAAVSDKNAPDKSLALGLSMKNAQGEPLLALDLSAGCTFDDDGMACKAGLDKTRLDLPWLSGDLAGEATVLLGAGGVRVQGLVLAMDQAVVSLDGNATRSVDLSISGDGAYDPDSGLLDLPRAELRLGKALVCTGRFSLGPDGMSADLDARAARPGELLDLLGPLLPEDLRQASFSGPVPLHLALETTPGDLLDAQLTLGLTRPVSLTLGADQYDLPPFSGSVHAQQIAHLESSGPGAETGWTLRGGVDVGGKPGEGLLVLAESRLDFDLDYLGTTTVVRQLSVRPAKESMLPVDSLGLSGTIERPREGLYAGGWRCQDLRLALGGLRLSGQASMDQNATTRASLSSGYQDLARLTPVIGALTGLDASAWGVTGTGRLGLDVVSSQGGYSSDLRLTLSKAGFFDTENGRGGQDLGLDLRLHAASAGGGATQASLRLGLDKGALLLGTIFLDFNQNPMALRASGGLSGDKLRGLKLDLDWKGFLALAARGQGVQTEAGWDWDLSGSLSKVDLGPVFKTFVADPRSITAFQGDGAGLSGTLGLDFDLVSRAGVTDATGRLQLEQGGLATADQSLAVEGLALDLPFDYRWGAPALKVSQAYLKPGQWGFLAMDAIRTPHLELHPGRLGAALSGNRFYLKGALELPVLGGTVRVDKVRCDEPFSSDLALELNAVLKDLDLGELPGAVPIQGQVSGDLGRVTLTSEALIVPGSISGTIFGGDLDIWGIYADRPLDPSRQMGLDMTIDHLDLEALSMAMDFGRVTGHLDIELRGFSLAYGEPVTMWLRAETTEDDDSDKTVSLKAVNNLSVLGTGSGIGDVGVGMFAAFFEEFDYSKIGFLCELDNDRFKLNGLIRDGGTEYLIKKPFLTGINVVNRNPDSTVSFRDMLERVERVMPGESSEGPEIQMN